MDILTIIKENLPDGVDISDKALKAIEKEIKAEQGKEFVPKEQYSKKADRINELEIEISDLKGSSADGEAYKTKYETLKSEFETYKTAKENEVTELKTGYETEKATAAKAAKLKQKLLDAGANPKYVEKIARDIDISTLADDGDSFKDWDKTLESVKPSWSEVFGTTSVGGVKVDMPPAGKGGNPPSGNTNTRMNAFIRGIKE